MIVEFNEKFDKDLSKLNKTLIIRIFNKINILKKEYNLSDISGIRKMSGFNNYYRIRIGDYRLGFRYDNGIIVLERFLHRKDIYDYFPK